MAADASARVRFLVMANRSKDEDRKETEPSPASDRAWAKWTGAGFEFAASVLLFFFLGSYLGARGFGGAWAGAAGAGLGIVVGTYLLLRQALRSNRDESRRRDLKRP